ncbi:MAG: hypothetical protein HGA84_06100, partial [Syntrophobacteraceae bacterium]|nr:hypothetical protein [Syntrophobacteraceae bacterium]
RTLDANGLAEIRAAGDVTLPAYREHLQALRDLQGSNPDIAYIYVMRSEGRRITFVIDSDTSERQALPGQEYTDDFPLLKAGFVRVSVDDAPAVAVDVERLVQDKDIRLEP